MDNAEELNKKLLEYEYRMGIGEDDPAREGYLVLVEILRQQNTYLKTINIKDLLTGSEEKGKASEYERAKSLWEGLQKMIQSVSVLRLELKMDGDEKKNKIVPISSKAIANGEQY